MSGDIPALALHSDDVTKMLAAAAHIGCEQCTAQMVPYVYKCRADGLHILKVDRMWQKLLLAARAVAAVEHPQDVYAVSSRTIAQRAVLKFAHFTGCTPIAGRFTPGTFTNQAQKGFREPRLLICSDPLTDHQAIFESSYANVPVVAFCNTDARLKYVDVAVPCNTRSAYGIGLMWWLLTREVLRLRGTLSRPEPWSVLPDLYFYRSPEEVAKEEQLQQQLAEQQQRQRTAQVDDVADLVAAVVLDDDGDNGRTAAAGGATATTQQQQHRDDEKWPDMFKIADWNETMAVDDEAQRAQNTSAATWGGHNALF